MQRFSSLSAVKHLWKTYNIHTVFRVQMHPNLMNCAAKANNSHHSLADWSWAPTVLDHLRFLCWLTLYPGQSGDFTCAATIDIPTGAVCTALQGTVGEGKVIFIVGTWIWEGGWLEDRYFHFRDHKEAASRLLHWLVEEPSSRLPTSGSFDAGSVLARFSTTDPAEGRTTRRRRRPDNCAAQIRQR